MPRVSHCIESHATDPYANLAIEACLMRSVREGEPILYLWQNARTVVIGRNQCASEECDVERLESEGGHLARRRSGGGAVYHDLGNLNFTFVTTAGEYDQARQTEVVLDAVRMLGIDAKRTGRNDLATADGRKFSGHAYYHAGGSSMHHGTIMVAVDVETLGRYLTVSPLKLEAKGVRSVRSRVTNLQALRPGTTIGELKEALRETFAQAMGGVVSEGDPSALDPDEIERERAFFASRKWIYRGERTLDERRQARFDWGSVRIDLTCRDGTIRDVAVYSDALDTEGIDAMPQLLVGAAASREDIGVRLREGGMSERMAADITHLIVDGEASGNA